jgi:hypothetical protein
VRKYATSSPFRLESIIDDKLILIDANPELTGKGMSKRSSLGNSSYLEQPLSILM